MTDVARNLVLALTTSGGASRHLEAQYEGRREVPAVGACALYRYMFSVGLLIGVQGDTFKGRYFYQTEQEARDALEKWDGNGDPPGNWIKYSDCNGDRLGLR